VKYRDPTMSGRRARLRRLAILAALAAIEAHREVDMLAFARAAYRLGLDDGAREAIATIQKETP
jgi:hypothetical protein